MKTTEMDADQALARLIRRTVPNGDCLEWQGQYIEWNATTRRGGYGLAHVPPQLGYGLVRKTTVHRIVHAYCTGDTPPVVMHTCDNRKCINPSHLESGTYRDNTQDMIKKGRSGTFKLTAQQVAEIRRDYIPRGNGSGYGNGLELAREYGVSRGTIWRIVTTEGGGYA